MRRSDPADAAEPYAAQHFLCVRHLACVMTTEARLKGSAAFSRNSWASLELSVAAGRPQLLANANEIKGAAGLKTCCDPRTHGVGDPSPGSMPGSQQANLKGGNLHHPSPPLPPPRPAPPLN
ncbi:hypothetical protein D4764_12G0011980 [Takifugu flavidus]|uniref:Uncharacterized protein n=1 Tax=Takifugu flavidus TaxID=433684 RepID=A0A5C6PGM9_9TELE|nr:hypothetical protein D4764_12G0011980 [Takifugu flavidus]